ncbi:MAG: hypothetical protein WCG99_01670 [Candidatus Berkelbacteria bacterium]
MSKDAKSKEEPVEQRPGSPMASALATEWATGYWGESSVDARGKAGQK